jgi:hypothetical protein
MDLARGSSRSERTWTFQIHLRVALETRPDHREPFRLRGRDRKAADRRPRTERYGTRARIERSEHQDWNWADGTRSVE